ncbi:hypothetical protein WISP_90538 [Willisornis vidua]|uniref:Uncharacterized protein n=1 Tax=Willisornis vidua TaxID=1566151 RepID=A0ABQ9D6K5_9PASS|nr:hypothetical protein WISP_90538 [Willisornis vidua]
MQFSILLGGSKAMSRITTLDFMRANFDLFRDLFGRIPLERANGKSGPRGIFEDHFLHTQDWCIPSPREKSGEVSEDWDKTNVTPVFKKGKKKDLGNYRPVSFTSVLRKVIEWLILEGICKRVEDKKFERREAKMAQVPADPNSAETADPEESSPNMIVYRKNFEIENGQSKKGLIIKKWSCCSTSTFISDGSHLRGTNHHIKYSFHQKGGPVTGHQKAKIRACLYSSPHEKVADGSEAFPSVSSRLNGPSDLSCNSYGFPSSPFTIFTALL